MSGATSQLQACRPVFPSKLHIHTMINYGVMMRSFSICDWSTGPLAFVKTGQRPNRRQSVVHEPNMRISALSLSLLVTLCGCATQPKPTDDPLQARVAALEQRVSALEARQRSHPTQAAMISRYGENDTCTIHAVGSVRMLVSCQDFLGTLEFCRLAQESHIECVPRPAVIWCVAGGSHTVCFVTEDACRLAADVFTDSHPDQCFSLPFNRIANQ